MHLYLTSHFQLNTKFVTESGQVLYRSKTPYKGGSGTTTITKVLPNLSDSDPARAQRRLNTVSTPDTEEPAPPSSALGSRNPYLQSQDGSDEHRQSKKDLKEESEAQAVADELQAQQDQQPSTLSEDEGEEIDMQDRFAHMATIRWNFFGSSAFTFGEHTDLSTGTYFGRTGFGPYGRHRTFTASNGREYKWKMGWWTPTLVLSDGKDTPVAKFHRKLYTFVKKKGEPSLEIYPDMGTEDILDEVLMSFVYVETIRKRRERASRY